MRLLTLTTALTSVFLAVLPAAPQGESEKAQDPAAQAKARAERFKKMGYVAFKDVWVPKDKLADAKKGRFHHDGEAVTQVELQKFQSGQVRHPVTGMFIPEADLAKAKDMFPIGEGWGTKAEADKFHSDPSRPWRVRTTYAVVVSTLPLDTILFQINSQVDGACAKLAPLFGGRTPPPTRRPVVQVLGSNKAYAAFGDDFGDGGSTYGACVAPRLEVAMDGSRIKVAAANWHKDWGPYYVRHAAGMAYTLGVCGEAAMDLPRWFLRAMGGYVERHYTPDLAKYFAAQHHNKGGVQNVKKWLEDFTISADLPARGVGSIDYNVFQAGMIVSFAMRGGNQEVTAALQKLTAAIAKDQKLGKPVLALGKALVKNEAAFAAYLDKIRG